ncbi:hypothetical protein N836_01290 [Leptolyngbya sp. Heron Island J]|nr:hypothetical protein N836_01290 [Leptolyngbya sp. Heron Island J]
MEGVEGPVVEALQKEQESEDGGHTEAGCKEPAGLAQGVHQEHRHEHGDGCRESDGVVRTQADEPSDLELPEHESNQGEGTMECDKRPEAADLTPANEVTLSLRPPEQEQGVAHAVSGRGDSNCQKVSAFEIGRRESMGIPGRNEGGASEPAANGQEGAGEQQQTGPADEDKSIALEPVIDDVEDASISSSTAHCNGHLKSSSRFPNQ